MSIGKRIIQARTEAGLNQSQLAKQLNVSPQSVQHWENDRTIPRNKRVQELSELLKVSSSWLMGFSSQPTISDRIQERLNKLNIRAVDIAKTLEVSKGAVSQWINGTVKPSGENLFRLSKALKCSQEWLISGTGKPEPVSIAVLDNSMSPRIIQGDAVTINPDITELVNDGIFALTLNGETQLRRATSKSDGRWLLSCDNREFAEYSEVYSEAEARGLNIVGIVSAVQLAAPVIANRH